MTSRWSKGITAVVGLVGIAGLGLGACGGDDGGGGGADAGPLGGALTVTGEVVDFETGAALTTGTTLAVSGVVPSPTVAISGAAFTITEIPENSAFQLLATAPPTHRSTFSPAIVVTDASVDGVRAPTVSQAFLDQLATGFDVTPTAAKGVMFVRLVDAAGQPRSGVAGSNLVIGGGAIGPKFLDASLAPLPNATVSTASGWAVFFEVPTGVVTLGQAANATVTLDMASSPVLPAGVTLASATVTDGAPVLPTNVSFAASIYPLFTARGCVACHAGGGAGKDLGGLFLDGGANLAYRELVEERPGTRVNLGTPEASFVLTLPSREDPPDRHPNITFASPSDPDYVKLLVWIREGALNN